MPKQAKLITLIIVGVIALIAILSTLSASTYTIKSGEKGIVLNWNSVDRVVGDGLHFKVPFQESVVVANVRTQTANVPGNARTRDTQTVGTTVVINYHLDENALKEIYSKTGLIVDTKIIQPRVQEILTGTIAKYTAEELLSKREEVKTQVQAKLRASLLPYNIIAEDVQLTGFEFSKAFDEAIENKQTAEQNAKKAENDLRRIEVEAKQKIEMAKAEAEAIRIQSEAIRAQGGQEYVQLKAIEKWDGTLPTTNAGGAVPFINLK